MKQVIYSITKLGKNEQKFSGVGYMSDTDLLVPMLSQKTNKPYIRIFDCVKKLAVYNEANKEFSCKSFCEIIEIDNRTIEVYYNIWLKVLD